VTRSVTPHLI